MPIDSKIALGEFECVIGRKGDITAETDAILLENGVDTNELNADLTEDFASFSIPTNEFTKRRDLRDTCTFTIDSEYSRDLDDALHCRQISDDIFEIGVHISDVSFFIRKGSELDNVAQKRLTSVYLFQKVIPMLPRFLCEKLCSLIPNQDRLTFSVIWRLNSAGDILDEWFGRTIINSVAKLSYNIVQNIIENQTSNDLPVLRDEFKVENIINSILYLDKIAKTLHKKRLDKGGLLMDKTKLCFSINQETLLPLAMSIEVQKESNLLVAEFMILANSSVARHIHDKFPKLAVLKCHTGPMLKKLQDFCNSTKDLGYECDISSSSSIQVN
jgi:DIS3-like exonuclease 2